MFKRQSLALAAALLAAGGAQAAISVTSTSFSYDQRFDSLAASGTTNVWANDSTLPGWSLFNRNGSAITSYLVGNGSSNTGSFYSFGTSGSADRALGGAASGGAYFGSPASGAVAGYIAVAFTNHSGSALSGFNLSFDGEQWRNGGSTGAQTMALQMGTGSSFAAVGSWTPAGAAFDWASPVTGATAAAVNGNVAGRVAVAGGPVNLDWANGQTLWLRWVENNDVGNDHGLAIDNLQLSVTAVPEPATYGLMLAGMLAIGFSVSGRQRRL